MSRHAGVLRDAEGLDAASSAVDAIVSGTTPGLVAPSQAAYEATNVATVASAVLAAATARVESRGCHRRRDHPAPMPEWVVHLRVGLSSADAEPVTVVGGPRSSAVAG
ncbi:MAG: hypothetical protein ABWZ99_11895, partial [Ilumatobacteraceae bacterium]